MRSQVAELTYRDAGSARAAVNAMNGCARSMPTPNFGSVLVEEGVAALLAVAARTVLM